MYLHSLTGKLDNPKPVSDQQTGKQVFLLLSPDSLMSSFSYCLDTAVPSASHPSRPLQVKIALQLSVPLCLSALWAASTGCASQEKPFPKIYLNLATERCYLVAFCPLELPPAYCLVHLLIFPTSSGYSTGREPQPSLELEFWREAVSTCSLHPQEKAEAPAGKRNPGCELPKAFLEIWSNYREQKA